MQPLPQTSGDANPNTSAQPPMAENAPPPATKPKHPRGDRSHIQPNARPIVDILTPEIARIKAAAPQAFKPQVDDMEKRINILFDHLNNDDLLRPDTVEQMGEIARSIRAKEWDRAQGLFNEMSAGKLETEGTHWMVS